MNLLYVEHNVDSTRAPPQEFHEMHKSRLLENGKQGLLLFLLFLCHSECQKHDILLIECLNFFLERFGEALVILLSVTSSALWTFTEPGFDSRSQRCMSIWF